MSFSITSPAFAADSEIPQRYTCDDEDISPPLHWTGAPATTQSLVLIMDDPDAPDPKAPKMTWIHWLLYNLPADLNGLPEAVKNRELPAATLHGKNSWNRTGYGGPCPPIGRHRYYFKLYALDCVLPDLKHPDKNSLLKNMQGHILAETQLMGTYQH
jgi:Raf kinase inhibitor-like YbhB/YbcL family protein